MQNFINFILNQIKNKYMFIEENKYLKHFYQLLLIFVLFSFNTSAQTYECSDVGTFNNCYINAIGDAELSRAYSTLHPGKGSCDWGTYSSDDLHAFIRFSVTETITDVELYARVFFNQYVGIWLYENVGSEFIDICSLGLTPIKCNIDNNGYASINHTFTQGNDYLIYLIFERTQSSDVVRLGITDYQDSPACSWPLPITLLNFDAVKENGEIRIFWQTRSEINNNFFTIEKSNDAIKWHNIGNVNGAGNSNKIIDYEFYDTNTIGIQYYRLKQTDYDGRFEYSKIISIEENTFEKQQIIASPNPVNKFVQIKTSEKSFQNVNIKITNTLFQTVIQTNNFSGNEYNVDLSFFPSGFYFVEIISAGEIFRIKIMKD